MEMAVVKPVVAAEVSGRGSRRRRKREGMQRGERNRRWLLVVGWWLCWLPVVELMVGRPVMRVVVAEGHGGERGRGKRKIAETRKMAGCLAGLGPDFLLSHAMKSISIYRRWNRAILSTQGKIFQPLIRLGRIPTIGSK
jgi:hypothetical protein